MFERSRTYFKEALDFWRDLGARRNVEEAFASQEDEIGTALSESERAIAELSSTPARN